MNYDGLKQSVEQITLSDDGKARIIRTCYETVNQSPEKTGAPTRRAQKPRGKRLLAAAVVVAACVVLAIPALAATVPEVYDVLYAVSPGTAQFFKPVQVSCEDNGIQMEVVSAYLHGDTGEIYVTLQDLEGDRLDDTVDLFDSYSINTPFDCSAFCQRVSYDPETKKVTFLVTVTQWNNQKIEGDKITFSVKEFLSNKQTFDGPIPGIDLGLVEVDPLTQISTEIRGGSGLAYEAYRESFVALQPSAKPYSPLEGVSVTAMGYVDGSLRIQAYYENIIGYDNHGYFYFMDHNGSKTNPLASVSFWDEQRRGSYEEYIFPISPAELEGYTLYGYFVTCDTLTKGDWEVTFPLENEPNEPTIAAN